MNVSVLLDNAMSFLTEFVDTAVQFINWCFTTTEILGLEITPISLIMFDVIIMFLVVRIGLSINQ